MSKEVLSQDEVDTLLAGVNDDDIIEEVAAEPTEKESGDVKPYDLATQERLLRGRMPTLESINERFAKLFSEQFFGLTGKVSEVSAGPVSVNKYSDFIAAQVMPSSLNVVQVKPLRGKGLLIFEPQLVCTIIDGLFGGTGQLPTRFESREFSPTEQRIITNLVAAFAKSYSSVWSGIYPIELQYERSEMHPQFASVAAPSELVVSTQFGIEMEGAAGAVHLCIPYATLEPIRETLYASVSTDQLAQDATWLEKLSDQLEVANLELAARLSQTKISFGELLNLQAGDFIELDLQEEVEVSVDDVPFLRCRYGTNNNHYAVKIVEFLTGPQELVNGDSHG